MKRMTLLGTVLAAALIVPAGAQAATLSNDAGVLSYAGEDGTRSAVGFSQTGPATVDVYRFLGADDDDPITATGCTLEETTADFLRYECAGVTSVVAEAGDGNDVLDAGGAAAFESMGALPETILGDIPVDFDLGDGDDLSAGGGADDTLLAGDGDDMLALDPPGGGPGGDDIAQGGEGSDDVLSGRGDDTVDLGGGDDHAGGGPGDDTLVGGSGDDSLASGPGDDTLRGDAGSDTLTGECEGQPCPEAPGADDVSGGDGFDLFRYESYQPGTHVTITLDNVPDDGTTAEGDNVRTDVEDVHVTGPADATVTGSSVFNSLTTGGGDDVVNSRDGAVDSVACGSGTDVANVDDVDVVHPNCETVNRVDTPAGAGDRPPTVAWSEPASGARLSTSTVNTLAASASDDKGIARVDFLDDERTVCSDTTAPYTCDYRPTGDDVGRNTLVAIAVDTSGQTASAVRSVRVSRFAGRLSARTTPRRDTRAPYRFTTTGRLTLPAGVTRAQGCRGTITVQIKAGKKTVSTRRVKLRSNCTYRSRVTFRVKQRLRPRTLRRSVRFGGNSVMAARSASRQTLRIRR